MLTRIRRILKTGIANSDGSVTVEACIVLPVILLMLFSMVFFSMYAYQKLVLLDTAVYMATQRAETWDNADKNLEDGYFNTIKNGGLYWRLFSDSSGLVTQEGSKVFGGGPQLVQGKNFTVLASIKEMLKHEVFKANQSKITVEYKNHLLRRTVSVDISEQIKMPVNWISNLFSPGLAFTAEADVAEPVEFIRMMGLAEKYLPEITDGLKNIPNPFIKDEKSDTGQPGKLIASKGIQYSRSVRVFHYQGCRYIGRIKAENLIEFDSPGQANASGYFLCLECAKRMVR